MHAANARIAAVTAECRERPPGRRRQDAHVAGRSKEDPERGRRSTLIRVHARDRQEAARADGIERSARLRDVNAGVEHGIAQPEHQHLLGRAGQHAQELSVHAHELGVVLGSEHGGRRNRQRRRLGFDAHNPEHRVPQDGLPRADPGESCRLDQLPRAHLRDLLGLDPHAAGGILYVQHVQHVAKGRGGREIVDLDRPSGDARRDDAPHANAAVDFAGRGIVVDVAAGPGRHRERIGRGFENDHVPDSPGKQGNSSELLAPAEDRADVAAQLHAGIDEPGQVLVRIVPEHRPDQAIFGRDVGEHQQGRSR